LNVSFSSFVPTILHIFWVYLFHKYFKNKVIFFWVQSAIFLGGMVKMFVSTFRYFPWKNYTKIHFWPLLFKFFACFFTQMVCRTPFRLCCAMGLLWK
jgi:hypothetical protein